METGYCSRKGDMGAVDYETKNTRSNYQPLVVLCWCTWHPKSSYKYTCKLVLVNFCVKESCEKVGVAQKYFQFLACAVLMRAQHLIFLKLSWWMKNYRSIIPQKISYKHTWDEDVSCITTLKCKGNNFRKLRGNEQNNEKHIKQLI